VTLSTLTEPMRLTAMAFITIVVAACGSTATASPPPMTAQPSPRLATPTPDVSPRTCVGLFTPPPYDAFLPVPGVSVRAIDRAHFEITNATSRTYYFGGMHWATEDNLVCGRGVVGRDSVPGGRLGPGATVEGGGGSTPDSPMTGSIWADPCGEGCDRVPLGQYLVPVSMVEPPVPVAS
jgi:hypothetical protein